MNSKAFSLVELSIVLVILGLLTGGILAGQSLIRAASLRSIPSDYTKYYAATMTFRDKYFAIPGDMNNAVSFWDSLGGDGSNLTCQNLSATSGTATCNGDGDGTLLSSVSTGIEWTRFWQHLANAGLVEGFYSGTTGGSYRPGINVPVSKFDGSSFFRARDATSLTGTTTSFTITYGRNRFEYWRNPTPAVATVDSYPLKPEDAWNIDSKIDDGIPGTGSVIAMKGNATNTNCATFAGVAPPGDAGSIYQVSNPNRDCPLYFTQPF